MLFTPMQPANELHCSGEMPEMVSVHFLERSGAIDNTLKYMGCLMLCTLAH